MARLNGKVVKITGCAGEHGFGRAIAPWLAADRADLVLTDIAPGGTPGGCHQASRFLGRAGTGSCRYRNSSGRPSGDDSATDIRSASRPTRDWARVIVDLALGRRHEASGAALDITR